MDDKQISEFMKEMGSRGGKKTKETHGAEHYKKLAENMNHKREVKKQERLAKELGPVTEAVASSTPVKKSVYFDY